MRKAFVLAVLVLAISLVAALAPMASAGRGGNKRVHCHNHHNESIIDVTLAECNQIANELNLDIKVQGNHAHLF